jgi:hypothetical protein
MGVVAISAKIESWIPAISENMEDGLQNWLLLQKPADGISYQRFPHRVRVSVNTGGADELEMEQAFRNISVRLGWFPTSDVAGVWLPDELVKYWDKEIGGNLLSRDAFLPRELFEEKSPGVFEATVWYAGEWEPKVANQRPKVLAGFKLTASSPNYNNTVASTTHTLTAAALMVDADRDGVIQPYDPKDKASETALFHFWSNDDDDIDPAAEAATTGTDWQNTRVDGEDDLADFFPVFLDIKQLLAVLPHTTDGITYKLKHAEGRLNFVYTSLRRATAFNYLTDAANTYGPSAGQTAATATTQQITAAGVPLDATFLTRVKDQDQGVILVEGCISSVNSLVLTVEKNGASIAEISLNLSLMKVAKVTINTFIPQNNVEDPRPFVGTLFKGDNRNSGTPPRATWNENGPHRTQQKFWIVADQAVDSNGLFNNAFSVNADGNGNSDRYVNVGETKSFDPATSLDTSGNLTAAALADTITGEPLMIERATATKTQVWLENLHYVSPQEISVTGRCEAMNPLVSGPSISYTITLSINSKTGTYTVTGSHDGFPAYEIYINGKRIYQHDPLATGDGLNSLFPDEEYEINEIAKPLP